MKKNLWPLILTCCLALNLGAGLNDAVRGHAWWALLFGVFVGFSISALVVECFETKAAR